MSAFTLTFSTVTVNISANKQTGETKKELSSRLTGFKIRNIHLPEAGRLFYDALDGVAGGFEGLGGGAVVIYNLSGRFALIL